MQNRIDKKFSELKKVNKKALVAFVTSGDPNQKISKNILNVLRDQKIDLVDRKKLLLVAYYHHFFDLNM